MRVNLESNGRYELLLAVSGNYGGNKVDVGASGACRFCSSTAPTFLQKAHTFPEALGNKWVFSLDECDACNALFSKYESALTECLKPFLTLGGVRGKRKVPQSGRSLSGTFIRHAWGGGQRRLFWNSRVDDLRHLKRMNAKTGNLQRKIPIPSQQFAPRLAYKALAKMAIGILPAEELPHYSRLRNWLQEPHDDVDFPALDVLMSFASIGNAPLTIAGTLIRRISESDVVPHLQFFLTAGSVCLQIDLMSDDLEDHIPPVPPCMVKIRWSTTIQGDGDSIRLEYSEPHCLNWASSELEDNPVKSMLFDFDPNTCNGAFSPVFRSCE